MQTVRVVAIGNLKETFWKEATEEYTKRLARFCKLELVQLPESTLPVVDAALESEAKQILAQLKGYVVALAVQGKKLSSEGLSDKLEKLALDGKSEVTMVIGSSHGLSKSVLERADFLLSFSDMTFPHQLMRVVLLEQLYRAFSITANTPYHK